MALSSEDKKDVKGAFGKALANKVARATRDKAQGKVVHLSPTQSTDEGRGIGNHKVTMSPRYKYSDVYKQVGDKGRAQHAERYEAKDKKEGKKPYMMRPEEKDNILKTYNKI